MPPYENFALTELPNSEIEISAEVPTGQFARHRKDAVKKLSETAVVSGFRKGHVPEDVLIRQVGEAHILEDAAETAIAEAYRHIIEDHKLDVIGRPEVTVTKLAAGNPLGFKMKAALFPKFHLPDYRTIALGVLAARPAANLEVADAEIEQTLKALSPRDEKQGEESKETRPLTDEDVKKFGNFVDLADFKTRLKEDMQKQKVRKETEGKRAAIAEKIIAETAIPLPAVLIESELEKMFNQFRGDIERMGMKPADYFEKIKKTEGDMRKEWRPDAQKRAKLELILHAVAQKENIKIPEDDLLREVGHLMEHHKDADPLRARLYIEQLMTNEKVFAFLESQN